MSTTYDPSKSVKKGAAEGGIAASFGVLLGVVLSMVRTNNPDLPIAPESDAAVIGAVTGLLVGVTKWFRNRRKHV